MSTDTLGFYRTEAKTILLTPEPERLDILVRIVQNISTKREKIDELKNEISMAIHTENDLSAEEYKELLIHVYEKLHAINKV